METARDLTLRLQDLLRRERFALAEFLVALAHFDRERRWIDLGYTSLFYFLHRELGLSKGAAHYRKTAAELIQRFPDLVEPLRDGRLCLTTVVELTKVLTPENRDEVLPRFFHLSKSEAKEVAVEIQPASVPPVRDVVTTVRPVAPTPAAAPLLDIGHAVHPANQAPPARQPAPAVTVSVEPLTRETSRVHVTVSRAFLKKLESARDALSHSHPGAGVEEILEAGLDLLLERDAKRKALVKRPRAEPPPSSDPDHVPTHVRRAVWTRDGGRCQWPTASGDVCGSTRRVQIDHRVARARGGPPTVENLRCLCRTHNLLAARETFGDAWMDPYARNPRAPADAAAP
jgi:hypothetical protein